MVKAKVFLYEKRFEGMPDEKNFKLVVEELPPLTDGEILIEAVYLSVDPYMRAIGHRWPLGVPMIGVQIAKIIESKHSKFPVGLYVSSPSGWRSHTVVDVSKPQKENDHTTYLLPDFHGLPLSLGLGILGVLGNTAYFGFLDICKPKAGETIVVSGAAGAVGNIVGQIAKIKGCKVIGITGSDEKGKWLVDDLVFDHFINYKTSDVRAELGKLAPEGVDCYFDNIGGEISTCVLYNMNRLGRVSVCGAISVYNNKDLKASLVQYPLVFRELKMEGFLVDKWLDRWNEGVEQNLEWIRQGKLKYKETITEGFENMVKAFVDMLKGGNIGKAIVKV